VQAAAKKVNALLTRCDADGRIRGALRYHGASTGRWAGNGLQPQNLKRPEIDDIDAAITAVSTGDFGANAVEDFQDQFSIETRIGLPAILEQLHLVGPRERRPWRPAG
jgi:hypothetical protein